MKCSECSFSAKSRKGLRAHGLFKHFHCNECSDKFENREEILDHLENVHSIKFKCKTCNTRYFTGMISVCVLCSYQNDFDAILNKYASYRYVFSHLKAESVCMCYTVCKNSFNTCL